MAVVVVRMAAATAVIVVVGCLTVAVPCLLFAGVGLCFHDETAADAALTAVGCGTAAAAAAAAAVVCRRRSHRRRPAPWSPAWN